MADPFAYLVSFLMVASLVVGFVLTNGMSPVQTFLTVFAGWAVALIALSILRWRLRPRRHQEHPGDAKRHAVPDSTETFGALAFEGVTGPVPAGDHAVAPHHPVPASHVGPTGGDGHDGGGFDGGGGGFDGGSGGSSD